MTRIMHTFRIWFRHILLPALLLCTFIPIQAEKGASLPYRFLLVISSQWEDPASYVIENTDEFQVVVCLLKNWGIPFDILRLDQQNLDRYHMLDRNGNPRYGSIIWDADPEGLEGKDPGLLASLVRDNGVGLVVLGNTVSPKA